MKFMVKLDKKDRDILCQLDADSRQTNAQIARKVRASKEVVGYRIDRMRKEGVIEGFYALADITKLGYMSVRMFFKFKNVSPKDEEEIYEYLNRHPATWWVCSISGSFVDSGIAFWVRDIEELYGIKEGILNKFRGKMEFYRESIYSKFHVWRRSYLSPKNNKEYCLIPGSSLPVEVDGHDMKILSALSSDARMPLAEIAKKVGLGATATAYRMKKLKEKGVILGFRPKINLGKIGQYWYKVEFQLENYEAKNAMLAHFGSLPSVVYAYESIGGGTDLEMEAEVSSPQEWRELIDSIRSRFKTEIRTYTYYVWSHERKLSYFPKLEFLERMLVPLSSRHMKEKFGKRARK